MTPSNLLTPRQAAERLGISYASMKHWILAGRIHTIKTPGGHHRVPIESLEETISTPGSRASAPRISGRNKLVGTVLEVTAEGLQAKVVLEVAGQRITAIISAEGAKELGLSPGDSAFALVKATEVMIAKS
jgi:molybdopterin-binding protein